MAIDDSIAQGIRDYHNLQIHLHGTVVGVTRVGDGFHIILHTPNMEDVYLCQRGEAYLQVTPTEKEDPPYKVFASHVLTKREIDVAHVTETFNKIAQAISEDLVVESVTVEDKTKGWTLRDSKGRLAEVVVWNRRQVKQLAYQMLFEIINEANEEAFSDLFGDDPFGQPIDTKASES